MKLGIKFQEIHITAESVVCRNTFNFQYQNKTQLLEYVQKY